MQNDICKFYTNTLPFYVSGLNICELWYLLGILDPNPCRCQGLTVCEDNPSWALSVTLRDIVPNFTEILHCCISAG